MNVTKNTYGGLYNGFAVVSGYLAPTGCHIPTLTEWQTLNTYLGTNAGLKLKEIGTDYWTFPGGTNTTGFGGRGGGCRNEYGVFDIMKSYAIFATSSTWMTDQIYDAELASVNDPPTDDNLVAGGVYPKLWGYSVRCLLDDPGTWHAGMLIVDYDNNIYNTVQIGTQVWLVENLKTEHLNDGTLIPNVTDNTAWSLLSTPAMCYYDNDTDVTIISTDSNDLDFNEPFNVVFSIGDVRNMGFGSNNKTYTLNIPLTKKNKKFLKFIPTPDVKSEPNAIAYLYSHKSLIMVGKVIVTKFYDLTAEVIINGNDWMDNLDVIKLSDIDTSDGDHTLTAANVEDSWSVSYPACRYPMIDFGALMSGEKGSTANWLATDFIPMISIAYLINKILAPYTIVSDWLNSAYVKDLFILGAEKIKDGDFPSGTGLSVQVTNAIDNLNSGSSSTMIMITLEQNISFLTKITDEASSWAGNIYTIAVAGSYRFQVSLTLNNDAYGNPNLTITNEIFEYAIMKNSSYMDNDDAGAYSGTELLEGKTYTLDTGYQHCEVGDNITVAINMRCQANINSGTQTITLSVAASSTFVDVPGNKYPGIGEFIYLVNLLPDMTQLDFLAAIRDIFNLRFWMDKPKGTIYIEPWDQLLTDEVIDITDFVDFSDKMAETISQYYYQITSLHWKDDTEDKAYSEYLKLYASTPGKKQVTLESKFTIPGIQDKEHSFSSVIMGYNEVINEYTTLVPRIWDEVPVSPYSTYKRKVGFNTRIVHWSGLTESFTWQYESATHTSYPKIEPIDWVDLFTNYWQKFYHYIDKGKLYTIDIKIKPGFLTQFLTVVNDATKEGFRPTYQITIGNVKYNFFLQKITASEFTAQLELILKW
jgi:uncharacterized protein (TIGR02145 family)